MPNIAIVGFGRIGRSVLKAGLSGKLFSPSVICDVALPETLAALFEFDSNYGRPSPWPLTCSLTWS